MFSLKTICRVVQKEAKSLLQIPFPRFLLNCKTRTSLGELISHLVHCIRSGGKRRYQALPRFMAKKGSKLLNVFGSPSSANAPKHVVIVMDGLKEFTTQLLEWVLENIIAAAGHTVTLLGVMPWLNIPLSSKTWQDVWMVDFEDLSLVKERNEWKNDRKYLKLQSVLHLCQRHGVVPRKEVVMGYPLSLLVVERIISLHATWVIFDSNSNLRKNREYFAKKIPCNMVMMSEEGDMDMIKGRSMMDNGEYTPGESPALIPLPLVIYSDPLKRIMEEPELEKDDDDD